MKRWWLVVLLVLSLGVNLGILGTLAVHRLRPQVPASELPPSPAPNLERLADWLDLAGPQRQEFLDIQRRFVQTVVPLRRRQENLRWELRRELAARRPDRQRISQLLEEQAGVQVTLERALAENILNARELLDGSAERKYLRFLASRLGSRPEIRQRHTPLRPRRAEDADPAPRH